MSLFASGENTTDVTGTCHSKPASSHRPKTTLHARPYPRFLLHVPGALPRVPLFLSPVCLLAKLSAEVLAVTSPPLSLLSSQLEALGFSLATPEQLGVLVPEIAPAVPGHLVRLTPGTPPTAGASPPFWVWTKRFPPALRGALSLQKREELEGRPRPPRPHGSHEFLTWLPV